MVRKLKPTRGQIFNSISVATGGLILSCNALYNGFPLIYSDTGTYIAACTDNFIPRDRPLTYSFFLRHISLQETLWLPMFVQCLLMSWLVLLVFRHFTTVNKPLAWHIGTILLLTLTTGLAANADLMIPDIFTSVLLLSGALLLFGENVSRRLRIVLLCLYAYAMTTHLSHYPLACALAASLLVIWFFRRKKVDSKRFLMRSLSLGFMVPSAIVLTLLINYQVARKWQFNPGSGHVFMINRLIQCGILNDYLDKTCPDKPYRTLCNHRPEFGQDFLWDERSPINTEYGWDGWQNAKPEYDSIISEVFHTREYLIRYITADFSDAGTQLLTFRFSLMQGLTSGAVYDALLQHFPKDHAQYVRSKQARAELNYDFLNSVQSICCSLAFIALLVVLCVQKWRAKMKVLLPLTLWILSGMIFNALTVVSVAMIDARYQSRLIWILPLLIVCYLAHVYSNNPERSSVTQNFQVRG